jgi:class 3 adenylate cyclase/tetratricopeptide (TPR) repeat protein
MEGRRERKVVTVLFADLVGFTARAEQLDPEDVEAILRPYHERLRGELERFGGTVEKFIGDAVMALFGAPVAHEDDPERAVRAALAIRDWARGDDAVQVRIAVNMGEALINLDARPEAGEGMAAGDVVNTTARLQAAAPVNGVIVGETAYRATQQVIDYRDADSVDAKGKAEPLRVWEAIEPRSRVETEAVSTHGPLIGREHELDQLVGALTRARREHSPQLVTLVGVPGIGKSRVVSELFAVVDADPEIIFWRHGRSLPYGDGVTFWAVAEMVKAQAGILETDTAEEAGAKLRSTLDGLVDESERDRLEVNLRPLVGLAGEAETGGDRRAESFSAWRRFFEALADRRPLVLIFEDLHWADDDLLDFVDELADWVEGVPMLVLCTARPELFDRRPGWGGGKRNAVTVSLAPLGEDETARLIAQLLNRSVLPAETQTALLARAGGNPLYAEQFVRMYAERGEEMELPETVQGIIAARLDSLDLEGKSLLQDAAVLGKVFWTGALGAIGSMSVAELEERLRPLVRREFITRGRRSSVAGETEYEFGHVLVRDVAYGQIPRAERVAKHRRAAEWIESLSPDRSEDRAEMLAHHYLAALEFARAAGLDLAEVAGAARAALNEAADRAASLGSYAQSIRLYDAALELWPEDDPERLLVALRREHAVYEYGEFFDLVTLDALAGALASAGRTEPAAEGEMLAAKTAWAMGKGDVAERHGDRALELMRDAPASPTKAMVLIERGRLLMLAYQYDRSKSLLDEGLPMAERFGLERLRASGLVSLGTMPDVDPAVIRSGIEIALRTNDVQQIQRGYNNLAERMWIEGNVQGALDSYDAGRLSTSRLGGRALLRWFDAQQGFGFHVVGEWDRAFAFLDGFLAESDAGALHYQDQLARLVRAQMRYGRGDVEGSVEDAELGAAAARQAGDPQALLSLELTFPLLIGEAKIEEANRLLDELYAAVYADNFNYALDGALAMADLGREEELAAALERSTLGKPWRLVVESLVQGDYVTAADRYADVGSKTYEAHSRFRAAKRLLDLGQEAAATEQLGGALAFYRSVGATRYIREGEALLRASA